MRSAGLITIGDEILIGQVTNTNAAFIGQKLSETGIEVRRMLVVGDEYDEIISAFREFHQSFDCTIVTGGLGPTHDDITKKVVADFFNVRLVKNERVLELVRERLLKRGIPVKGVNEEQALVPETCEVLLNYWGTAPGMMFDQDDKIFVSLPGVPYEMQNLLVEYVIPRLQSRAEGQIIKHHVIRTTGIAESMLYEKLGDIESILGGRAKLAFLPSQFGVRLRITAKGKKETEVDSVIADIESKIIERAAEYVYAIGDVELEKVVGDLLRSKNLTLAVAESCTGGYICHRITNISGSSAYFNRGVISYSNEAKVDLLSVDENLLRKFGAVSAEVAMAMAEGVRVKSNTDVGLSVTGIAGPTGGTPEKPVGLVYIGYSDKLETIAEKYYFSDDRVRFKERTSQAALDLLRKKIQLYK
jgi:nicotinamide-nucleotide amidase